MAVHPHFKHWMTDSVLETVVYLKCYSNIRLALLDMPLHCRWTEVAQTDRQSLLFWSYGALFLSLVYWLAGLDNTYTVLRETLNSSKLD